MHHAAAGLSVERGTIITTQALSKHSKQHAARQAQQPSKVSASGSLSSGPSWILSTRLTESKGSTCLAEQQRLARG